MMGVVRTDVRRLGAEEWEAFRAVRLAALGDSPEAFASTLSVEESRSEDEWRGRLGQRVQLLASRQGQVVGTIGLVRADGEAIGEVISMWVAPSARGSGVGDALLQAAIEAARVEGYSAVELWVANGNSHAEGLYARHGFARTGQVQPIRRGEPERTEFEMTRAI